MKTRSSNVIRFIVLLALAAWTLEPRAAAQSPASLGVQLYAGLTITGTVGNVYSVEYVTDLAQEGNPGAWRCLDFLQLPTSPYLWADKSAPVTGRRFYRARAFPTPTNMVFISPGTFRMGSSTNDVDPMYFESPQTAVTISRGFWMGKYEVTQGEFLALMGSNPTYAAGDTDWPVDNVMWEEATNYCGHLTLQERAAGRIPTNSVFRLPTEAEWEYACRAWTSTRFSFGDDPNTASLTNYAWYAGNYSVQRAVGQKLPNPWGLHDMHGSVWEWCQDWWGEYPSGIAIDPQGPAAGPYHISRGGSRESFEEACRSAGRVVRYPEGKYGLYRGFRVVLASAPP